MSGQKGERESVVTPQMIVADEEACRKLIEFLEKQLELAKACLETIKEKKQ